MGAMLTSVSGFAEVLVRVPDHPERQHFLSTVAAESRRSVTALRDLQLVRGLLAEDLHEHRTLLDLGEVARDAGIPIAAELAGIEVSADRTLLMELLARCARVARGEPQVDRERDGSLRMILPLEEDGSREELGSWRESFRPIGLAAHVFPRWGIGFLIEHGPEARVVITFPA